MIDKDFTFTPEGEGNISYKASTRVPLTEADDSDFSFVQQDKSIHDVKFTTKPTTFFRDAMRRFVKNKSSVVGGIILGVLFLMAIIIPIGNIVPYDISGNLTWETNLPPKLFEAGTGFWDGTVVSENEPYPYEDDENGNHIRYIGEYPDDDAILSVSDRYQAYQNSVASDGSYGFATAIRLEGSSAGRMVSYAYNYDFSGDNDYIFSYTLGTSENYAPSEYRIIVQIGTTVYPLSDYTADYGAVASNPEEGASVTTYETVTNVSLRSLIENYEQTYTTNNEGEQVAEPNIKDYLGESQVLSNACLGFQFYSDYPADYALYVRDFELTGTRGTARENAQLRARSFSEGNEMASRSRILNNVENPAYWTVYSDQFTASDVVVERCTIVYDQYELKYGSVANIDVSSATMDEWVSQGLVEIDYSQGSNTGNASYVVTELGAQSNDVYVEKVNSQERHTDENGNTYYSLTCTVTMWKYLGYESMPSHLLGTDANGKDMLKYVFSGLRNSLLIGIVVSAINICIGIIWGSISGYFGGKVDLIMERFVDILAGIPWIVLMTVLCLVLGQTFIVFALALCLTGWIGTESVTRSQFYRYRGREYVLASKTLGAHAPRLIFRHILPNAIGTIVTSSVLMIPSVIFNEATISYLGLGFKNLDSLGVILSDSQNVMKDYPYQLIIPAVIISLLMICFNLFGNGLRDAFNPSLKGSE